MESLAVVPDGLTIEQAASLPLRDIGLRFGSSGLNQALEFYIAALDSDGVWTSDQADDVRRTRDLALWLHRDDKRSDGGDGNGHILRTTLRLIRDFGITDRDMVIAMLMHDSVEDHPEKVLTHMNYLRLGRATCSASKTVPVHEQSVCLENRALLALQNCYSSKIAGYVAGMTFPSLPKDIMGRQREYLAHTERALMDLYVQILKLSDFFDNAVENGYTLDLPKQLKMDLKQIACYALHKKALRRRSCLIAPNIREVLLQELQQGCERAVERLLLARKSEHIDDNAWSHTLGLTDNLFGWAA